MALMILLNFKASSSLCIFLRAVGSTYVVAPGFNPALNRQLYPFSRWVKTQRYIMNRAYGSYDFADSSSSYFL